MRRFIALTALLAACSSTVTTTEPLIDAATAAPPTTASATTTPPGTSPAPPLVPSGCDTWDAATLTDLSPITNPLALIENTSTADKLVCNFIGVSDGIDTGIRIEIERVADQPNGHYTTAGGFESELELAGKRGVGSGRGLIRLLLDEDKGLTLAVTIRSLSSDGTIPRDGAFLDIRDAIATYLVRELG